MSPPNNYSNPNRPNYGGIPVRNYGQWENAPRSAYQNNFSTGGFSQPLTPPPGGAPPLPPRPGNQPFPSLGLTRPGFGISPGYGYSALSPYSSYGSYSNPMLGSMYGSNYGGNYGSDMYGNHGNNDSFMQMAEESSRQAFHSIESIVQAFGSVSMMLESTYHAVYSSFRAVIGVADHFSRLRDHMTHIVSTLAIVRTLHWLFRKALYMLGLSGINPASDRAWNAASKAALDSLDERDLKGPKSSWPILMFLSVVFGAPWLIWRILASVTKNKPAVKWMTGEDDHFVSIALHNFQSEQPKEISFKAGDKILLAPKGLQPKCRGWMLGSVDGATCGLVPANYIKILGPRKVGQTIPKTLIEPTTQQPEEKQEGETTLKTDENIV